MGFVEQIEIRKWVEYLEALEEERKKIQVFQRELPLCLELVTRTIERCRRQLMVSDDEICGEVDVPEEFTTPKRSLTPEELEEEEESSHENQNTGDEEEEEEREQHKDQQKSNWFQSVQLSIKQPNRSDEEDESKPEKWIGLDLKMTTGAFQPFHRDQKLLPTAETPPPLPLLVASGNSMTNTSNGGSGNDKSQGQQSHRKTRRCWSPELHRQFLRALHELGGSHVATPKQIRELMKVDGLTNDEVKSHLQKYRLHTRRPSQFVTGNGSFRPSQFILVGGIWVPPQPTDFATTVVSQPVTNDNSAAASTTKIYAPVASLPLRSKCNNDKNSSMSNTSMESGRTYSNSPATSNSSLTVTTSPAKP